jgi:hypothetical protein
MGLVLTGVGKKTKIPLVEERFGPLCWALSVSCRERFLLDCGLSSSTNRPSNSIPKRTLKSHAEVFPIR